MDDIYRDRILDYLNGNLTLKEAEGLRKELEREGFDLSPLDEMEKLGKLMDEIPVPEPGDEMKKQFHRMLEREKARMARRKRVPVTLFQLNRTRKYPALFPNLAYGVLILLLGIILGNWVVPGGQERSRSARMMEEIQDLKKMMTLTLFEQGSASDRLKAVSYTSELSSPDDTVIEALLKTLNNDPSVNVRLASLEALIPHVEEPEVREGLIRSINMQDAPLIQVTIAELMIRMKENRAVPELEKLLKRRDLNETVEEKLKETISVLI